MQLKYIAFISYSSTDARLAKRLHQSFERYAVPHSLRGGFAYGNPISKRLGRFFLDQAELSASHALRADIETALTNSQFLVVLCTPKSAQSRWVQLEIEAFEAAGKRAQIIPVLAAGEPLIYDPEDAPEGAFPKELFDSEMTLGNMPLAPDFRGALSASDQAEAKFQDAFLRLVARFLDVPFPDLIQRQRVYERGQLRKRNRVIAALVGLLGLAVAGGAAAWVQKNAADQRLAQAIDSAAQQVEIAWRSRDRYRVPTSFRQEMFDGASEDFTAILDYGGSNPGLLLSRARYHLGMYDLGSDVSGSPLSPLNHLQSAQADVNAAEAALGRWYARFAYPHSPEPGAILRARIDTLDRMARLAVREQRGDEARALAEEAEQLAADIAGGALSVDRVYSQCALADVRYHLNERRVAENLYRDCLRQTDELVAAEPSDAARDLRVNALIDYGMILRLNRDQVDDALELHREAVDFTEAFLEEEAASNDLRLQAVHAIGELAATSNLAGHAHSDQIAHYSRARDALDQMIASDPTRKDWQVVRAVVGYRLAGAQAVAADEGSNPALLSAAEAELDKADGLIAPMLAVQEDDVTLLRISTALAETRAEVLLLQLKGPPLRDEVQPIFDLLSDVITKRETIVPLTKGSQQGARDLANAHLTRGRLFHDLPDYAPAVAPDFDKAREIFLDLAKSPDFRPNVFRDLATTDFFAAQLKLALGQHDAACRLATSAEGYAQTLLEAFPGEQEVKKEYDTARSLKLDLCRRDSEGK